MRRLAVLLAVLLSTLPAAAGSAGGTPADLAGIKEIRIAISQVTPDASACGIDLRELQPLVSGRIVAGGLSIDPAADVTITLSILTGYDRTTGACASAPMLGAYRQVSYFDEKAGWLRSGQVVLWQRGTATTTTSPDHADAVRAAVTRLADTFLESWRSVNTGGLANR
ncbi:hypothetical protein [Thalassobaculum sp.]|uniref:hypothetical protein n=1 Tax=Thalassobaculum sp. TaxID=2022740 RepID=UPI0032ED9D73